jgi:hypothetical protein
MKRTSRWLAMTTTGLGLTLAALTGCQTWVGGMTLPSGHYLQHQPQFFPPSPPFPLPRELAAQQAAAAAATPGAAAPAVPPPPPPLVPAPVTTPPAGAAEAAPAR